MKLEEFLSLSREEQERVWNRRETANNGLSEARSMFERLWKLYPNKKGKGSVSDARKKVLFGIGEEQMTRCIQRYVDEHEELMRAGKFCPEWKNGSTFFNSGYIDYLDENYGPAEDLPQAASDDGWQ